MTIEEFVRNECVIKTIPSNKKVVYRRDFFKQIPGERGFSGYPSTEFICGADTEDEALTKAISSVGWELKNQPEKIIDEVKTLINHE